MVKSTSPCTADSCEFMHQKKIFIIEKLIAPKVRPRPRGHEAHGVVERSRCRAEGLGRGDW